MTWTGSSRCWGAGTLRRPLATKARIGIAALRAAGLRRPRSLRHGRVQPSRSRHTRERDAEVVRHHYDVSNDFFELFLDETMTYSCALFEEGPTRSRTPSAPSST